MTTNSNPASKACGRVVAHPAHRWILGRIARQCPGVAPDLSPSERQLAGLAVNAANALHDEKRHYRIAAEENARLQAEVARLTRLLAEAVRVSEALNRRLYDEKLAGSALYAAMTQPTTPEQRQAALDQFQAVAQQVTTTEAGDR
ncbi:hypothetical protein ACIP69_18025 [Streptomyces hygroscopicus]|uniref:hypothetical protein n=1 Tax=Streptomyces hygroscopicus TaxID=1912 RepID=UPI00381CCD7D